VSSSDIQLDELGLWSAWQEVEEGDGDGEAKATGTGGARIEVEHASSVAREIRHMGVPGDNYLGGWGGRGGR
jgi:hypothetical protein